MAHLAHIVESAHHAHRQPSPAEEDGDAFKSDDVTVEHTRLRPKRSASASVPNSPRSQPNNTLRSPSLSVPHSPKQRPSRGDTEAIDPQAADFVRTDSGFRSAWSYRDPEEERKSSRRSRRGSWTGASRSPTVDDSGGLWRRWVEIPLGLAPTEDGEQQPQQDNRVESPQSEHAELGPRTSSPEPHHEEPQTASGEGSGAAQQQHQDSGAGSPSRQGSTSLWPLPDPLKFLGLTRTQSMPHIGSRKTSRQNTQDSHGDNAETHANATQRWNALRQRLRQSSTAGGLSPLKGKRRSLVVQPSMAAEVDLNEELMAGPLALQILRMWFERDENGRRRVPVLLQHLKIRVSDSVHPLHGTHAVFRIEVGIFQFGAVVI